MSYKTGRIGLPAQFVIKSKAGLGTDYFQTIDSFPSTIIERWDIILRGGIQ